MPASVLTYCRGRHRATTRPCGQSSGRLRARTRSATSSMRLASRQRKFARPFRAAVSTSQCDDTKRRSNHAGSASGPSTPSACLSAPTVLPLRIASSALGPSDIGGAPFSTPAIGPAADAAKAGIGRLEAEISPPAAASPSGQVGIVCRPPAKRASRARAQSDSLCPAAPSGSPPSPAPSPAASWITAASNSARLAPTMDANPLVCSAPAHAISPGSAALPWPW
mmetsp:Transcript_22180/g.67343  ORF Transcript_22180/g.67343 Transcript_22180/m.67343 type:complete len:224 (+) Transcript_22180:972-1643(+)